MVWYCSWTRPSCTICILFTFLYSNLFKYSILFYSILFYSILFYSIFSAFIFCTISPCWWLHLHIHVQNLTMFLSPDNSLLVHSSKSIKTVKFCVSSLGVLSSRSTFSNIHIIQLLKAVIDVLDLHHSFDYLKIMTLVKDLLFFYLYILYFLSL